MTNEEKIKFGVDLDGKAMQGILSDSETYKAVKWREVDE